MFDLLSSLIYFKEFVNYVVKVTLSH